MVKNKNTIINKYLHWLHEEDKKGNTMPRFITRQMLQLYGVREFCKSFPTCEGCPFREEHTGCAFRGKTPREW